MRIITLLLLLLVMNQSMLSQRANAKAARSKNDIQSEMNQVTSELKKQIAELEKQLKTETDPDTIKDIKEQIVILQKQLDMMQGLNNNVSMMSDNAVQEAVEDDGSATVPKRDMTRIGMLPKKNLTEAQLHLFIKNVQLEVEKIIPTAEKVEALKIYNETKAEYKSTAIVANAASGCWMLGHWEKALYIMGKACIDDMDDADNLNNYAAFLIMTGGEHASLPILEHLNEKYPENSTILNNIGQAWFGLGDIEKAKKVFDQTKELYPNHAMANNTLANIYEAEGDNAKAIYFLKASIKENYDTEKEAQLRRLGYEITFADMPPLNYPMKKDPIGLSSLLNTWDPNKIQSSIGDEQGYLDLHRYLNGVKSFKRNLQDENLELDQLAVARGERIKQRKTEFLAPYNSPAHILASRTIQLYCFENSICLQRQNVSPMITALWLPLKTSYIDKKNFKPVSALISDCEKIWFKEVEVPWAKLAETLTKSSGEMESCADRDAKLEAYLTKQKEIYKNGVALIKAEANKHDDAVTNYLKYAFYADIDEDWVNADVTLPLIAESDRILARRARRNMHYGSVVSLLLKAEKFERRFKSTCNTDPSPLEPNDEDDLTPLKVRTLDCQFVKKVITPKPVNYKFVLHCNKINEESDPKLPKKKVDVQIGEVHVTRSGNSSSGPINGPRGPNVFIDETDNTKAFYKKQPLTSEHKDVSQFSLEYNKWGNLVGFNFQLSEDGSTLKDPDSVESGVDSRWSWNAIASAKKSYLNKLIIR